MTEFRPVGMNSSVNVSNRSPVREFFTLLAGLCGLVLVIYISLGFAVDFVARNISIETENSLLSFVGKIPDVKTNDHNNVITKMQARVDRVYGLLPTKFMNALPEYDYTLIVVDSPLINAVALPGGRILIFRGLLEELKSDSEIVFVLGHELGHFANHDHLRGLGRQLILGLFTAMVAGPDSGLAKIFASIETVLSSSHSRKQEFAADDWGIRTYEAVYNTTKGASNFMKVLEEKETTGQLPRWTQFLSSRPHAKDRIKRILKASKN